MSITLHLAPEAEAALIEQAEARGIGVDEFVQSLLEQANLKEPQGRLSREETLQAWEEFCEGVDGLPSQPGETFSREMIYFDHD